MAILTIEIPVELETRLRGAVPAGAIDAFVTAQIERGLDEAHLQSMDDAIAHVVSHEKPVLDRLGDVHA